MSKLKYTTLLDYILAALVVVKADHPGDYVSLVSLLKAFDYKMSFNEIQEIGKYFDARGWARVLFLLGDVRAQATTKGNLYIDEKPDEFNEKLQGFLEDLTKQRQLNGNTKDNIFEVLEENEDPKKNIFKLIDSVTNIITEKKGEDSDLIKDLEVIKIELSKSFPDFQLIEIKLNKLSTLDYISAEVQELKDYLLVPAN